MKRPQHYRAEYLTPETIEDYTALPDTMVNIAFADALVWVANKIIEEGLVVTPEWLLNDAIRTYEMVQRDLIEEAEEEDE